MERRYDHQLLDAKGASQMLSVGESTFHRYCALGLVPKPVKIGGSTRWDQNKLSRWIDAGCPSLSTWKDTTDCAKLLKELKRLIRSSK